MNDIRWDDAAAALRIFESKAPIGLQPLMRQAAEELEKHREREIIQSLCWLLIGTLLGLFWRELWRLLFS